PCAHHSVQDSQSLTVLLATSLSGVCPCLYQPEEEKYLPPARREQLQKEELINCKKDKASVKLPSAFVMAVTSVSHL
ncbi:unnamed protein product, partial [Gulo gulo]